MKNGKIKVPNTPGLGLDVDQDALHKFTNPTNGVADIKELMKQ